MRFRESLVFGDDQLIDTFQGLGIACDFGLAAAFDCASQILEESDTGWTVVEMLFHAAASEVIEAPV